MKFLIIIMLIIGFNMSWWWLSIGVIVYLVEYILIKINEELNGW